jgi:SAM-dependent methyltransferase
LHLTSPTALEIDIIANLDRAHDGIQSGRVYESVEELLAVLGPLIHDSEEETRSITRETCARHPIASTLLSDPITRRSVEKPRGYPGDAELLDLIYGAGDYADIDRELAGIAREVYRYTYSSDCGRAVRFRRHLFAECIDRTSSRVNAASIASIACGHFREVESSAAFKHGRLGRIVAFDQDEQSLARVQADYGKAITSVCGSVRDLLTNTADLGTFDLIYSAGLLDYLPEATAKLLAKRMFATLRPGGQLLLANFRNHVREAAYLDCFMQWRLIYRDQDDMVSIMKCLPPSDVANLRIFGDYMDYVIYASVEKAQWVT